MNVGNTRFTQITDRAKGVMEKTRPSRASRLDTPPADTLHGAAQPNLLARMLLLQERCHG